MTTFDTLKLSAKSGFRSAVKLAWWMIKLTVLISLGVTLLQYFGVLDIIARWLAPLFAYLGLPGEGALVFIFGALVNHYAAIAAIQTIGFDARSTAILALMCLCAHNLIIETAIQKKTGSSVAQMLCIRLLFAVLSALILNLILPASDAGVVVQANHHGSADILTILRVWAINTAQLMATMFVIITALTVLQRILGDLGVIRRIAVALRPLMRILGLPAKTSFLWVVSQTLGLAYGAAVMVEEKERGKVSKKELDLLNYHIAVSHSNVEDVMLYFALGVPPALMYSLRIAFAIALVWSRRLFAYRKNKEN